MKVYVITSLTFDINDFKYIPGADETYVIAEEKAARDKFEERVYGASVAYFDANDDGTEYYKEEEADGNGVLYYDDWHITRIRIEEVELE